MHSRIRFARASHCPRVCQVFAKLANCSLPCSSVIRGSFIGNVAATEATVATAITHAGNPRGFMASKTKCRASTRQVNLILCLEHPLVTRRRGDSAVNHETNLQFQTFLALFYRLFAAQSLALLKTVAADFRFA